MENIKITVPMMEANGGDVSLAPVVAYSRDGDFWRSFMFVPRHVAKGNLKKIYQATCVPNMGGGPGRSFANRRAGHIENARRWPGAATAAPASVNTNAPK